MSPVDNDYTPIIRQGTIEKASGILGRRRIRQSLPDAGHGEELILIEANGGPVSVKGHTTAGERYWGSLRAWVIADVSDHHLSFHLTYRDTDGAAGYEVTAVARVTIADAAVAVRRNVRSVRAYVEPALRSTAEDAISDDYYGDGRGTLTRLNTRLGNHQRNLRNLVGRSLQVEGWLSAVITDLSIEFDHATASHYDQLVAANRGAEIDNTTLINRQQTAQHEIGLRRIWAAYLGEQVSDPITRAVAAAVGDPTADNIKEVADKLDADVRLQRDQFIATLNRLIDNKVIVELDDIKNTKVIIDGLQKGLAAENAQETRMITDSAPLPPDKTVMDAHIVDDRPPYDSDRDWGN